MNEEKLYKALERLLAAVMLMRNGCHERDWLNPYWDGPIQEAEHALKESRMEALKEQ